MKPDCLSCSCTLQTGCKKAQWQPKPKITTPEQRKANVEKVAKWYAKNKEYRHAYLRERYRQMKGGEVRSYGQLRQKLTTGEGVG